MTYKELLEVWNSHTKRVKDLMAMEDVYSIILPRIGTLSFNYRYMKVQRFFSRKDKSIYDIFENKIKFIEENQKKGVHYAHNQNPSFLKMYRAIKKMFDIRGYKRYKPIRKAISIIESYSNNRLKDEYKKSNQS